MSSCRYFYQLLNQTIKYDNDDISLEKYIDVTYPEILKSISKEKYLLDYVKFDLFS